MTDGACEISDPYALYRYFDIKDLPLYIGISGALAVRDKTHISRAKWMQLAARSTVERYKTLEDVKDAERKAIEAEHPLFNVQYNNTPEAKARIYAYLEEIDRLDLCPRQFLAKPTAAGRTTLSTAVARARWGDVMMLAWKEGKHVHVTVNGKPRVVVVSEEWFAKQESER